MSEKTFISVQPQIHPITNLEKPKVLGTYEFTDATKLPFTAEPNTQYIISKWNSTIYIKTDDTGYGFEIFDKYGEEKIELQTDYLVVRPKS